MVELLFFQNIVFLSICYCLYNYNKRIGLILLSFSLIAVLKDLNIHYFAAPNIARFDETYVTLFILYVFLFFGNLTAFILAYFLAGYTKHLGCLCLVQVSRLYNFSLYKLLLITLSVLVILSELSGYGFLNWVQSPRSGYQYHRSGIGPLYMVYNSLVGLLFFIYWCKEPSDSKIIRSPIIILIILLAHFSGNKGLFAEIFLVSIIMIYLTSINLSKPILVVHFFSALIFYFIMVEFVLPMLPGYLLINKAYFTHFNYSIFIIDRVNELGLTWVDYIEGVLTESIPRRFWPSKPFFHGNGLLSLEIFNRMEAGHTVGFLPVVWSYSTLGSFGPFIKGMFELKIWVTTILMVWSKYDLKGILSDTNRNISRVVLGILVTIFAAGCIPSFLDMSGSKGIKSLLFFTAIIILVHYGRYENRREFKIKM